MSIGSVVAMLVGLLLLVLGKVCLDLASKQVQGWLFDLCFVVLRVARRRLPAALRMALHDEELVPELKWILLDRYANEPVVGLYKGFRFALSNVRGAKRLARESVQQRLDPRWQPTALTLPPLHLREAWEENQRLSADHPRIKAVDEAWDVVVADIRRATAAAGLTPGRSWRRCLRRLQRVTNDPRWTQIAQDVRKLHKVPHWCGYWCSVSIYGAGDSGVSVPTVSTLDAFLTACAATRNNIHRISCGGGVQVD